MINDSYVFETKMVRERVKNLFNSSELKSWFDCKWSRRFMAYPGKVLVVFTLNHDKSPKILDKLTCTDVSMYVDTGLCSTWQRLNGVSLNIDTIPCEVLPQVFLWHTYNSEAQYSLRPDAGYGLRFSMLMKAKNSINFAGAEPGTTYILELQAFNERFW